MTTPTIPNPNKSDNRIVYVERAMRYRESGMRVAAAVNLSFAAESLDDDQFYDLCHFVLRLAGFPGVSE